VYAFIEVDEKQFPDFDDQRFGLELLEQKHVLIAPGSSFNIPRRNRFRITTLPDVDTLNTVFARIDALLADQAP
jgi:alanine-synthesizing transaminase